MRVRGVVALGFAAPPVADRLDGKLRGVVSGADVDRAAIGLELIDSIEDGQAEGLGSEIVIVDEHGLSAPGAARILETTDQLLLFGINADDRLSLAGKAQALSSDMAKLLIALGAACCGKIFTFAS